MSRSPPPQQTSITLLGRLLEHDARAWARFSEIYTPLVFRWAQKSGLQTADVADITQDVFRVVATKLPSFRPNATTKAGFRRWLWGITRNVLRQHFDANSKGPLATGGTTAYRLITGTPDYLHSEDPPEDPEAEKSLVQRALVVIESDFEPHTWQAFWRMTIDQEPAADIGDDLGMTTRAVRQAKYRVLCRVRDELMD